MRKLVLTGCLAGVCFLTGCAARTPRAALNTAKAPASTPVPQPGTYVDLQPQWRLRVVTPILKSGRYVLETLGTETDGKTVTVDTGGDFPGIRDRILYRAASPWRWCPDRLHRRRSHPKRRDRTSGQIDCASVSLAAWRSICAADLSHSGEPGGPRYGRGGGSLHGQAERSDVAVRRSPASACHDNRDSRDGSCSWVPQGIAVRPEVERTAGGVATWGPAR